jgi:hypothetical protein
MSHAEREELNRCLKDALDARLARLSRTEFGSPILLVREANGCLRLCIEYRGLNEVPEKDAYPLPRGDHTLDDSKDKIDVFTHLDLASIDLAILRHCPD